MREFLDALERLEAGCTVLDAEIVTEAVARSRPRDRLRSLTGREREVLTLMAEGRTNAAIASGLTTLVGDGRATAILGAWGAAAIGIGVWTFRRRDA